MRILIVEDDFASRKFLSKFLSKYGNCDLTIDGVEAVEAFSLAYEEGAPYDLVCLDIMMPNMDGKKALQVIREFVSVFVTTVTDVVGFLAFLGLATLVLL